MARRAILRSTASRTWLSRSAAANAVSLLLGERQPDLASSSIASSALLETMPSPRLASSMSSSSLCLSVSELMRSLSTPPSASLSISRTLQFPFLERSFVISTYFPASLCSSSAGFHSSAVRALAGLRQRSICRSTQQLVADLQARNPSMQQIRSVSKLKSYKMKAYSSYKERFRLMADGTFKRWRSGTRHNAHSKTAKQRRQLRRPSVAPAALAKVMKKLNFVR